MHGLRARVAKKAKNFVKKAQMAPPGAPPAPGPTAPAPAVPPAPGIAPPTTPAAPKPPGRPPAGATPGVPPGAPKPKEEIEQEVEKDIRKKKETENKINELDEKVTAISDQVEGLTKSINKLVNTIQKEQGNPTDFEKKFEEIKEENDEGLSSSEFGLGNADESLIVSKEGHKMSDKQKLRKARKERLQAKELEFHDNNPPNKKYKQQVPAPTITKVKDEPEDWGQYRLKAADMAMDLNAAGDEWAVVNKHTDQVFYKIKPTAETQEIFSTREFAEAVINDVREMGLEKAMEKYAAFPMDFLKKKKDEDKEEKEEKPKLLPKIKTKDKEEKKMPPVVKKEKEEKDEIEEEACEKTSKEAQAQEVMETTTEMPETEIPAAVEEEKMEEASETEEMETESEESSKEEVSEEVQPEMTASLTDIRRRFVRAFRLALSAQQKNLIDNPLKAAWYEVLKGLEIPDPERIIEATFARAAAEHFEATLLKTAEFLDMSDEAFVEMEAQIGEFSTQPPKTASEVKEEAAHKRSAALRARAHNASLPFSTASDADPVDFSARIANALPKPKLHGVGRLAGK